MLFVGDSITELQFESLKCLLGEHFDTAKRLKSTKHHAKTFGLQNKTAVEYIRSDYLLRLDTWKVQQEGEEPGPLLGIGYNVPWSVIYEPRQNHLITEIATNKTYGYSIVGCICFPDTVILSSIRQLIGTNPRYLVKQNLPKTCCKFRSSPYGHGNCSQYTEPMVKPNPPNGTVPWEHQWHLFPQMSNMWKVCDELAGIKLSGVLLTDVQCFRLLSRNVITQRSNTWMYPDCLSFVETSILSQIKTVFICVFQVNRENKVGE
ncbi:hypothetical protein BC943DRAFT_319765 [Umbelopsis sp. AD052]|nr:hypothetical protein BC943DRAFT_319765 [Umbelopsis sp. AD052]